MFTGIVTAVGRVAAAEPRGDTRRLVIASPFDAASIAIGASIACSGVCLTVTEVATDGAGSHFAVDIGPETLALTTVPDWHVGTPLNLERSLKLGDELGGHIVSGHVDGLAEIIARQDYPDTVLFALDVPPPLHRYIARKGSVALDGISLTVNEVGGTRFSVHLIPHTLAVTTFGARRAGDRVNLEIDVIARYAARLAETA